MTLVAGRSVYNYAEQRQLVFLVPGSDRSCSRPIGASTISSRSASAICSAQSPSASSSPSSPAIGDLRDIGSGNIGATNVLRTGNKKLAALTLLLDLLKGTAAVLIGARFGPDAAILAGLGAFLGHLFPVWLGFRGGKGVATYIGVLLGLYWPGGDRLLRDLAAWSRSSPATHRSRRSRRVPQSP